MNALDDLKVLLDHGEVAGEAVARTIEALLRELAAQNAAPTAASPKFFAVAAAALHRLAESNTSVVCVEACLAVAEHFFFSSQGSRALGPVEDAASCARAIGDDALLRRVLNFQGIMLADTGNFAGAIEAYAEALEYAARLPDRRRRPVPAR